MFLLFSLDATGFIPLIVVWPNVKVLFFVDTFGLPFPTRVTSDLLDDDVDARENIMMEI